MSDPRMVVFKRSLERWSAHIKRVARVQELSTVLTGGDLVVTARWRNKDNTVGSMVWKLRGKEVFPQSGGRPAAGQRVCKYADEVIRRVLEKRGVI